jgi:hypothetical protein
MGIFILYFHNLWYNEVKYYKYWRKKMIFNEVVTEKSSFDEVIKEGRYLISEARKRNWNVAADNMEHYLGNTGITRHISRNWLHKFKKVRKAEGEHQEFCQRMILEKIKTRWTRFGEETLDLTTKHLIPISYGGARLNFSEELFYASGNSKLEAAGHFQIKIDNTKIQVDGYIDYYWHDRYNFENKLGVIIIGHGSIPDDAFLKLEKQKRAKSFFMKSLWKKTLKAKFNEGDWSIDWRWSR